MGKQIETALRHKHSLELDQNILGKARVFILPFFV